MNVYRIAIITGQLGRIWTANHFRRKVYSSLAALGYFAMMMELYDIKKKDEIIIGNNKINIIPHNFDTIKFKKKPF